MKRFRKLISALLAAALLVSTMPLALAEGTEPSPTSYWNGDGKFKILLDPSFGGAETGGKATYDGVEYSTGVINYKIADAVKKELEQYDNVEIVMTRDADTNASIAAKQAVVAANSDADMLWTIWVDSSGNGVEDGTHCDIETNSCFSDSSDASTLNALGKECVDAAAGVMSAVDQVTGLGTATRVTDTSFSSETPYLRKAWWGMNKYAGSLNMPSLWFCFGDLTNEADARAYFTSDQALEEIGTAAARGLAAAYGLTRTDPLTIALEAGWDSTYTGVQGEKATLNLKIAEKMKELLQGYQDVKLVMCRTADYEIPLSDRVQLAIDQGADLYLALHTDSGSAASYDVYYSGDTGWERYEEAKQLAQTFTAQAAELGFQTNTYENTSWLAITGPRNSGFIGLDIEHGDWAYDTSKLDTDEKINAVAAADVKAIVKHYGLIVGSAVDVVLPDQQQDYAKIAREDGKLVLCIDPGHGGTETGAVATYDGVAYSEKEINLGIGNYLKTFLNEYEGVQVISTRTDDTTVSLGDRTTFAKKNYADYVISLHNNATGSETKSNGSMVLVTGSHYEPASTTLSGGKTIYQESESLALNILKYLGKMNLAISRDLGTGPNGLLRRPYSPDGGASTTAYYPDGSVSDYYAIVRQGVESGIPSILVEHAYMDNESEFRSYLMTDDQRKALARSDARAIAEYFGLKLKPAENAQDSPFADDGQFVVAIDPGHGGTETGAQRTWNGVTYQEKDLNWKIAGLLKEELSTYKNVVPVLTKAEDDTLGRLARFQNVLPQNPDLLFSIHNNAAGTENSGAHGSMVLITDSHYRADGTEGGNYTNAAKANDLYVTEDGLAKAVLNRLQEVGLSIAPAMNDGSGLVRRLWKQDTFTEEDGAPDTWYPNGDEADYYGIVYYGSKLGIPSMIVEHAYLDNQADCETYLGSDAALRALAHADALAIADYYNLEKKDAADTDVDMTAKGNFFKATTAEDFGKGTLDGTAIDSSIGDGAVKLTGGATEGTYTSPVYKVPAFEYLTPSWNADTPAGTSVELQGRVYVDAKQGWSGWLSWGRFGQSIQRGSTSDSDTYAGIDTDELYVKGSNGETASKIQYRVILRTADASVTPDVRLLSATLKNTLTDQAIPCIPEYSAENLPDSINLVGYPYSQSRRDKVPFVTGYESIGGEICSMTTITGMINFKGEDILPEELAINFRDTNYGFGNWPYSVAAGASFGYEAYVRYGNWNLIKSELAQGNLVGVSIKYAKTPAEATASRPYVEGAPVTTSGHLVLIRGYETRADGTEMVLVNDSAVGTDAEAVRAYRVDQFLTGYADAQGNWVNPAWGNTICYVLHAKDANAGNGSIRRVPAALSEVADSTNSYGVNEFELKVNDQKLPLPTTFTDYDPKTGTVGQGGIITVIAEKTDGTSFDGTVYPTIASKPATYGTASPDGNILVDLSTLIPSDYKEAVKVTAYVIYNNGTTYVAQATLGSKVDKTALEALYNANKDKTKEGYTEDSWNVFAGALAAADSVLKDGSATAAQVEKALGNLQAAVDGLTAAPAVDKTGLEALYNANKDRTNDGSYPQERWTAFTAALAAADSVLKDGSATAAQVEKALSDLQTAVDRLTEVPTGDKTALQALYNANKDKENTGYTKESWAAFTAALAAADSVLKDGNATAAQVEKALSDLQKAADGLTAVQEVDKTALEALYNAYKDKRNTGYTAESWAAFTAALSAADGVLKDDDATAAQVEKALGDLQAAVNGLTVPQKVDKSALQTLYGINQNRNESSYTPESWKPFRAALSAAEAVLKNADATKAQVEKALSDLQAAADHLKAAPAADKTPLLKLYDANKDREGKGYTKDSWSVFAKALSAAESVLKDAGATQAEVEKAQDELQKAIDGLTPVQVPVTVDKTALEALYQANKGRSNDGYTPESWAAFTRALSAADAVIRDKDATAEQVDHAADALERAVNALEKAPANSDPNGSASSGSNTPGAGSPQTGQSDVTLWFFVLTFLCALAGVCLILVHRRRAAK